MTLLVFHRHWLTLSGLLIWWQIIRQPFFGWVERK
jgi:hypothetical protein